MRDNMMLYSHLVNTGRCLSVYKFNEDVAAVAWNPRQVVLAVAVGKETRLLYPLGFVKMELPEQGEDAPVVWTNVVNVCLWNVLERHI